MVERYQADRKSTIIPNHLADAELMLFYRDGDDVVIEHRPIVAWRVPADRSDYLEPVVPGVPLCDDPVWCIECTVGGARSWIFRDGDATEAYDLAVAEAHALLDLREAQRRAAAGARRLMAGTAP